MSNSILDRIIASKEDQEKQAFDPVAVVQKLLQLLSTKESDVLQRRFGLNDVPKETLEAIGESYSVTRERIRQIQSTAVKRMKESPSFLSTVKPVEHVVLTLLEQYGNVMGQEHLLDELFIAGRGEAQERAMLFLLEELLDYRFTAIGPNRVFNEAWKIKSIQTDFAEQSIEHIVEIVSGFGHPVSFEVLVNRFKQEVFYKEHADKLTNDVILSYVLASKKIASNPFDEYGLQKWGSIAPKRMNDKIYLVLKKVGKPMHFVDIAKKITEVFTKEAYPPTVHNELILNSQYVLVGRGIYALKEWGFKRGVVADVIEKVLEQAGKPLTRAQIVEQVAEQRIVKKNTIHLALTNKERFQKLSNGTYIVATPNSNNA